MCVGLVWALVVVFVELLAQGMCGSRFQFWGGPQTSDVDLAFTKAIQVVVFAF